MACAFMSPRNLMSALGSLCPVLGRLCGVVRLWWLAWFASFFLLSGRRVTKTTVGTIYIATDFTSSLMGLTPAPPDSMLMGLGGPRFDFPFHFLATLNLGVRGARPMKETAQVGCNICLVYRGRFLF